MTRFGTTWWGAAWVEALEGIAGGRGGRLSRGRRFAQEHGVALLDHELAIEPGSARAVVQTARQSGWHPVGLLCTCS